MRKITIFGATGSIGQSTIDLIRRAPLDYDVVALTGGRNIARLAEDAIALKADLAVTAHAELLEPLRQALAGSGVEAAAGQGALLEAATRPADWIMSAIVGAAGLAPGLKALEQGTTLALANKESLVCAGKLLLETAKRHGARLLPVDSEHSAVFQALAGEAGPHVGRGGPPGEPVAPGGQHEERAHCAADHSHPSRHRTPRGWCEGLHPNRTVGHLQWVPLCWQKAPPGRAAPGPPPW